MQFQQVDTENATRAGGSSRTIRVAVCGEVSSGKSTVLNALLRARVLPDNIGCDTRPVVFAGHRSEPGLEIILDDGTCQTLDDPRDRAALAGATQIHVFSNHSHLSGIEIVEVPLTKAEELTDAQRGLIASSDVMIWVTIASQAWRLTEKTIVEQLAEHRPKHALLAVTRADKLRNAKDRDRLNARIVRETEAFFDSCIFVNGARKTLDAAASSGAAWEKTGASEILSVIDGFARIIRSEPDESPAPEEPDQPPQTAPEANAAEVQDLGNDRAVQTETQPDAKAHVAPAATESGTTNGDGEAILAALRDVADSSAGVLLGGLRWHDRALPFELFADGERSFGDLGKYCHEAFEGLVDKFANDPSVGDVCGFSLTSGKCRVLFQNVHGVGLVCLIVDAARMNQGLAQNTLARLCTACDGVRA